MLDTAIEVEQGSQENIEDIIDRLDKALEGRKGTKISEAWHYREAVRAKYGLPECGYRWEDPVRYVQTME